MKSILFFGDSLTAGYGLNNVSIESLPALIQVKINRENLPFKVINGGLSGDTTAGGLARIDFFLKQQIDILVLELGANDMLRGLSAGAMDSNLRLIIDKVKVANPQVKMLLLGMEVPSWLIGHHNFPFKNLYHQIAQDKHMSLVPFLLDGVAGVPHLNLNDGFHPSAQGYQIVANTVWPALKRVIQQIHDNKYLDGIISNQ